MNSERKGKQDGLEEKEVRRNMGREVKRKKKRGGRKERVVMKEKSG